MFIPIYILKSIENSSIFKLKDITGAYSSSNLTGWNAPNPLTSSVTSVYVSGTYYPAPAGTIPVAIPSVELMPVSGNPLPYYLWQQFNIVPSQFGFSGNTFPDGEYILTVSLNGISSNYNTYTIGGDDSWSETFSIGDTITDTTTGKVLGVVQSFYSSVANFIVLSPLSIPNNSASVGDVLTNGTNSLTINIGATFAFTNPLPTTSTIQTFITSNADGNQGNELRSKPPKKYYTDNDFVNLMTSKQQAAISQNNGALDSLYQVQISQNAEL